ncbi:MAG: TnpV protein [Faecalibacterium sp.]
MPNKTEEYLALACKTADSFSRQWEHWAEFLITAARLYKYSYPDQLMIYAQRPDATACAEYDVWNNKMNRYVRRGSKGIALLDESGGYPRLHYVFDVSDTAPRRNALYPDLWEMEQTAENRMQQLMKELLERNPAPDKEKNQMAWVQHMNSLKAQAEEMILTELIYS